MLALLHVVDELPEQVTAVLRAGGALRVILDAEGPVFRTGNAFYRLVQKVDVGDFQGGVFQTLRNYRIAGVIIPMGGISEADSNPANGIIMMLYTAVFWGVAVAVRIVSGIFCSVMNKSGSSSRNTYL